MAILGKVYDEKTRTDRVWYESSNVVYSKFVENEFDNNGQLYVTFKNGATYHYKDVDMPTDYLLFKSGGIACGAQYYKQSCHRLPGNPFSRPA